MIARAQVVAEARRWIRTPFAHQGRTHGVGCDCGGLVGCVAIAVGSVGRDWWDSFDRSYGGYGREPAQGLLMAICRQFMVERDGVEKIAPADVLLMAFKTEPQHLGIAAPYLHGGLSIVHALRSAHGVREHRLSPTWRSRVVAVFTLPGVA